MSFFVDFYGGRKMNLHFTDPRLYDADGDLSQNWFIDFFYWHPDRPFDRKRRRIYKGINKFNTARERREFARAQIHKLRGQLRRGTWKPNKNRLRSVDFEEMSWKNKADRFLKWQKQVNRVSTYQHYKAKFNVFLCWLDTTDKRRHDIINFSREDADAFVQHLFDKGSSNSTINDYVSLFRSLYKDFIRRDGLQTNVFDHIPALKTNQKPARRIIKGDLIRLVNYLEDHDRMLLLFLRFQFHTLARPMAEIRMMKVGWIDFENENLTIPAEISKNRIEATLPIPKSQLLDQIQYLREYPSDYYVFTNSGVPGPKHVSKNYFQVKFRAVRDELRLNSEYTVYSFKHTGAIMKHDKGASVKELQALMRHHSLDITNKYLRQMQAVDSDNLRNNSPEF